MSVEQIDLDDYLSFAKDLARSGGMLIQQAWNAERNVRTKAGAADLVTETDELVEKTLFGRLSEKYPDHCFIGEETTASGIKVQFTDRPTWIIDPIDGTTNFVHRFPFTCISIGFTIKKEPVIGIVYNPISDELFYAAKGKGAFCNEHQLQASSVTDISQSLLVSEFGSSRDSQILDIKFRNCRSLLDKAHGLRSLGSCALNMCYVAAGKVDGYAEFGIHIWDMVAGDLIVREAGGVTIDCSGGPLALLKRRLICAGTRDLAGSIQSNLVIVPYEGE